MPERQLTVGPKGDYITIVNSSLLVALLLGAPVPARAQHEIVVDPTQPGRTFEGIDFDLRRPAVSEDRPVARSAGELEEIPTWLKAN